MAENSLSNEITSEDYNEDEGNTVTMVEILEEEQKLEEDANAVLGGSDDKNCTYNEGYVKRQALYACMSCLPSDKGTPAGVCLACSYHCHEGHDLIELYTKRNFKCDCGNSLFGSKTCSLVPNKSPVNEQNHYNQNFQGLYCTCKKPYPDPDDVINDEMIQCIVCEDWFHTRHLGIEVPIVDNYSEMICGQCSDNLTFLCSYLGIAVTKLSKSCAEEEQVNVEVDNEETPAIGSSVMQQEAVVDNTHTTSLVNGATAGNSESSDKIKIEEDINECLLKTLSVLERPKASATFWPDSFRSQLCTCSSCKELYRNKGVAFLTDTLDTVQEYEEMGKTKRQQEGTAQYEKGLQKLAGMDRVKLVEALQDYNDMTVQLSEYLSKFAENKKVVRTEDIKEFFSGMAARKRQKVELPYFCH